jgi:hypothetical protein
MVLWKKNIKRNDGPDGFLIPREDPDTGEITYTIPANPNNSLFTKPKKMIYPIETTLVEDMSDKSTRLPNVTDVNNSVWSQIFRNRGSIPFINYYKNPNKWQDEIEFTNLDMYSIDKLYNSMPHIIPNKERMINPAKLKFRKK